MGIPFKTTCGRAHNFYVEVGIEMNNPRDFFIIILDMILKFHSHFYKILGPNLEKMIGSKTFDKIVVQTKKQTENDLKAWCNASRNIVLLSSRNHKAKLMHRYTQCKQCSVSCIAIQQLLVIFSWKQMFKIKKILLEM